MAAQAALAALILWLAFRTVGDDWRAVRDIAVQGEWRWIAAASVLILFTYALLVQTWRVVLGTWGGRLPFVQAARIWTVSSLGRYVPGKIWHVAAMGVMAQRQGVSSVAAIGSAVALTILSVVTGFAVVLASGAHVLNVLGGSAAASRLGVVGVVLAAVVLLASAVWLPAAGALASRMTGRELTVPPLPWRAVWVSAGGSAVAWLLYGAAFQLFTVGMLGSATGTTAAYIAAYTASYLVGYLVLFAPGGILFREAALVASLTHFELATAPEATVIAVASRLWLTVLEVAPGVAFLAYGALRRSPNVPTDVSS